MSGEARAQDSASARAADHALLVAAVRKAGALAKRFFDEGQRSWEKRPGHLVGEADLAVDRSLRNALLRARPDYGWLSEESDDDPGRLAKRRVFVVDPIDGTRAFIAGRPEFAISAALIEDGRPVSACVFNPATDELFDAEKDGGARLNGRRLGVSARQSLSGATLLSGRAEMQRKLWSELFPEARIEPVSSIAYKLALVAAGKFDAMVSLWPKHEWDIAAGDLLVAEAGGRVSAADGALLLYNRPRPRLANCVASNGHLQAVLIARLTRA